MSIRESSPPATASSIGVPAGSDKQVQYNNAGTLAGSPDVNIDNTNHRLGIGTSTPAHQVEVTSSTVEDYLVSVENSATNGKGIVVTSTGESGVAESVVAGSNDGGGLFVSVSGNVTNTIPVQIATYSAGASTQPVVNIYHGASSLSGDMIKVDADLGSAGTFTGNLLNLEYQDVTRFKVNKTGTVTIADGTQANGKVLTSDASGNASWATAPASPPAGLNTQVQFNSSGVFGADADFTWAPALLTLFASTAGAANSVLTATSDGTNTSINIGADGSTGNNSINLEGANAYVTLKRDNDGNAVSVNYIRADGTTLWSTGLEAGEAVYSLFDNQRGEDNFTATSGGPVNALHGYSSGGTAGVTAGPFTTITSITVVGGIVTALTGS